MIIFHTFAKSVSSEVSSESNSDINISSEMF